MAQIKFSKQHKIKEDKFIQAILNVRTRAETNKKPLLIGTLIVLVAALVVLLAFKIKSHINEEAGDMYSGALIDYEEGRYSSAISKFKTTADNYSGSNSAPRALFMLGSLYYDLGNYSLAIETFKRYVEKYGANDFMTPAVYKGLGAAYMQSKDYASAITAFQTGIKKCPKDDFSIPELRFKLARCFIEKQDVPAAKEQYGLILKDFPRSSYARESELRLAAL